MKNLLLTLSVVFLSVCLNAQEAIPLTGARKAESIADSVQSVKEIICENPDEIAEFPGGNVKIKNYLAENMQLFSCSPEFPTNARCYLRFTVLSNGKITDITVLRGVPDCKECDQEAVRLVRGMPDWIPAKKAGVPVASYFHLPIRFWL